MTPRRRFGKVRKLPSGRFQASYTGPDGLRRTAPKTFGNKQDAGRWLALVESDMLRGTWTTGEARRVTVRSWAERWLGMHEQHLKRTTAATYRTVLRTAVLPEFGDTLLGNVRPIDVGEWIGRLTARGASPGWVRQCYRLLSQIMAAAVDNDMLAVTPCRGHRLPREAAPSPIIITPADVDRIVAGCRPPHDLVVLVLAYGGLRIGEAFALRRCDVSGRTLTVARRKAEIAGQADFDTPKSHQVRDLQLPAFVADRLRAHLALTDGDPESLLFTGARGGVLRYNSWRRTHFDPAVEAAGFAGLTPHDLRASHASWVADSHGVLAAARRLGHANATVTTRHYARVVDGRDAEVAASLDARHGAADTARDVEKRASGASKGTDGVGAREGHDQGASAV